MSQCKGNEEWHLTVHLIMTSKGDDEVEVTRPWRKHLGQSQIQEGKPYSLSEQYLATAF